MGPPAVAPELEHFRMPVPESSPAVLPLVSVCISAYNHERYVGEAIDSILAQDYPNLEIIVVDDASTDGSAAVIEAYARRHPELIKAILLEANEGPSRAGNRAYAAANGEFVAFLGTDDRMLPGRLRCQVGFLRGNPGHVGVFSNIAIIDGDSRRAAYPELERLFNQPVTNLRRQLLTGNFLNAPSALLRRADLMAVGGSSPLLRYVQDYDLWGRLLLRGKLAKLDEVLTEYRVHGENLSVFGARGPSFAVRCETVSVIVSLVRQWPLQSLFERPLLTPVDEAAATLELVELLKDVDRQHFGKASLASALAYRLVLEASWIDPVACQQAKSTLEAFMMDGDLAMAPDDLAVRQLFPAGGERPLGVVIHAFYPDVLADILERLEAIQHPLYLYVTCPRDRLGDVAALLAESGLPHLLLGVENRGRDVLPFLRVLPYLQRDGIRFLLKLHTKKTLHHAEGSQWARELFDTLLDAVFFQATLKRFTEDGNLQVVGSERYRLPIAQYLKGNNKQHLQGLARRAGLSEEQVLGGEFFAGTMFFARLQGLEPLQKLGLHSEDFEPEQGQVEGTLAHAMERFFLVFAQAQRPVDRATLYRQWLTTRTLDQVERNGLSSRFATWSDQPSVLVVLDDAYPGEGLVARSLASLKEQLYAPGAVLVLSDREPIGIEPADNLLWLPRGQGWAGQLNEILPQVGVDWFYVLRGGDVLDPHALLLLAERIVEQPSMLCCYSDEDRLLADLGSGEEPVFKPDFNLDMLRSYPYVGRTLAFQRQAFLEVGGFAEEFADLASHDLLLRLMETHGLPCIGHLAEVLVHQHEHLGQWLVEEGVAPRVAPVVSAHLSRLGVPHSIEPGPLRMINRVLYRYPGQPLVSIVIPTKDQLPMLRRCVESLLERTRYRNYEVLIVDNASETPEAIEWLAGVERMADDKVRVLRYPHPFNFSAINNFAVEQACGEYLVLLNNDTAVIDGDWLEALLNHARRPEVGIVGARLHYPDGRIQHGGVVLGLRGVADHPFIGEARDAKGYMQRLQIDQNYSAVTAACLMIRKSVYEEIGGMDEEAFKVSYNDVDLCLKVGAAGYLTVWTPYAALIHEANVSQNQVDTTALAAKVERFRGEQAAMYRKWLPKLAYDPAYNRNLSLDGAGFALDHRAEAGWHPFARRQLPHVLCHASDPYGCGHYRVMQPFAALREAGLVGGALSERLFSVVEMERIAPDSVVFQRQLFPQQLEVLRDTRAYSKAFRIYELDDYIVCLPEKSQHRKHMPKDVAEWLRQGVAFCDRFVVSTAPLAEAFNDLHSDIRVVENRLPVAWWGEVGALAQRRVGRKPRVGWAGGSSHSGDLELIAEVVRELASEVEWVFFGMCPEAIRPYVHEIHAGVPIDQYPAKLASLNLDLALAPLEENLFNECKSNLRLLEYGICGFPVICTDLVSYRGDLPVTRVKNGNKGWIDAIRMHLADLDATAAMGDALQARVRRDWMLEGQHLETWRKAWLSD
jgi:glycosyltransferase involved in cell wall biosynthesis